MEVLRSSEDAFVDRFFGKGLGAPVMSARFPRAYVDLNRGADELDPAIISGAIAQPSNRRVAAGLGVIPRVVANGKTIRLGKLSMTEVNARLEQSYFPYHQALSKLIGEQYLRFGACFLFDIHSMPRSAFKSGFLPRPRPDIILGDRYGTSCDPWVSDSVATIFRSAGFVVALNAPFAGGYITQHYGAPRSGVHALQVEIDRGLYMDEKRIEPRADFSDFVERISSVMQQLANLPPLVQRVAAE